MRVILRVIAAFAGIAVVLLVNSPAPAQQSAYRWALVASTMSDQRWAPAACALQDGRSAVIAGGYSYAKGSCVASIDIYSEGANRFRKSRCRLTYPRDFAQASVLPGGTVLISGGFNDVWASLNTAEIYDPVSDTCRLTRGRMNQHRELFQAVTLADGTVLLVGGLDLWARGTVATAEIFHPDTEQFTPTCGTLAQNRFGHAACLLQDGRVLIVGGTTWSLRTKQTRVLNTAEIYDQATRQFHRTAGNMAESRDRPTVTLLPDGKVLIYGGQGSNGRAVTSAELFDPLSEQFTALPTQQAARMGHSATLLPPGDVIITGGWDAASQSSTGSAVGYDVHKQTFFNLPSLPDPVLDSAQVLLQSGRLLVAGGKSASKGMVESSNAGVVLQH